MFVYTNVKYYVAIVLMAFVLILLNEKAGSVMLKKINLMLFAGLIATVLSVGCSSSTTTESSSNEVELEDIANQVEPTMIHGLNLV